ncbi:glycosyltransferase family 1 protein [bacterium]|nr:MAG: glycosyltransferase family 1 protein [bacterium]
MNDKPKVLFLTKYPSIGASSRYRVVQFVPYLEKEGFECRVEPLHEESYLKLIFDGRRPGVSYLVKRFFRRLFVLLGSVKYSVVFVQKELFPYLPPVAELLLKLLGRRIVYDIDDAIFLFYTSSRSALVRFLLGGKIPVVMRASTLVLAGNRFLLRYASRYNRSSVYFPTVVDTSRFESVIERGARRDSSTDGVPRVVWIGSPETLHFLLKKKNVFVSLSHECDFRLVVIGAADVAMDGVDVECVEWSDETEIENLARCDIGIMPLEDDYWSKGKCGLKLLQYMACELPVVSSPTGGGEEIVEDGKTGFIARNDEEWVERLLELCRSVDLRRELGRRARTAVEERYSIAVWAPRMAKIIDDVIRSGTCSVADW